MGSVRIVVSWKTFYLHLRRYPGYNPSFLFPVFTVIKDPATSVFTSIFNWTVKYGH